MEYLDRYEDTESTPGPGLFGSAYRPQEMLTAQIGDAMVRRVNAIGRGPVSGRRIGFAVPETQANFVWLRLDEDTMPFSAACDAAGVSVRPFAGEGARVSIGSPEENDAFLAVAAEYRAAR